METSTYEQQALDFLEKVRARVAFEYSHYGKHFADDEKDRDVYRFTIRRKGKSYSGQFGQSIQGTKNGEEPTVYNLLACLTKYDPESFEAFCDNYGYDTDSRKAEKVYKAVLREWKGVERLFGDVLEEFQEIQ